MVLPAVFAAVFALVVASGLAADASRGRPDLRLRSILAPKTATPGATITISDTTGNSGRRRAPATRTSFYLSRDRAKSRMDRLLGTRKVRGLKGKRISRGTVTVTIPGGTTARRWYVVACADIRDRVKESSERNNCRSTPLVVAAAPGPGVAIPPPGGSDVDPPDGTRDVPLPAGVTRRPVDGGAGYYGNWENAFPADASFFPIGVWPTFTPASLKAMGINFMLPLRDDQLGIDAPIWGNSSTDDMTAVTETPGFYAGGSFYLTQDGRPWGAAAALNVFGDELDGACPQFFSNLPPALESIKSQATSHLPSVCAPFGGLTAEAFVAAERASHEADPSRPTYIQVTGVYLDHFQYEVKYTLADKQEICANADILSYDYYPVVFGSGPVYSQSDYMREARDYCQNARPVFAFIETDRMSVDGDVYPMPSQTVAEAWNAIIAGARGIQYFDNLKHLTDSAYDGGGHYAAGAMHQAVTALNRRILALAPVLNDDSVDGYVATSGQMSVLVKYHDGHPYIFAIPHTSGPQTVTFTLAGAQDQNATVLDEQRTIKVTDGVFADSFSDENEVHIYRID